MTLNEAVKSERFRHARAKRMGDHKRARMHKLAAERLERLIARKKEQSGHND